MKRRATVGALTAALVLGAHISMPNAALACSGEIDPVRDNDLIFMGRVVGLELASDPNSENAFAAVWVIFEVDRYLLGEGPRVLRTLDPVSVAFMHGQTPEQREAIENPEWAGDGGECGALDEDPRGQYWLTGASFVEGPEGPPHSNGTSSRITDERVPVLHRLALHATGGIGSGPDDPFILERLARIEALLAEAGIPPAVVGYGPLDEPREVMPALVAVTAMLALPLLGRRATSR